MPLVSRPSLKQSYWGCDSLTNQALWSVVIAFAIAGGTLLGEGYHEKDGPHPCWGNLAQCQGNVTEYQYCVKEVQCNGTWLSNGTCTSFKNAWCDQTPRDDMPATMAAGIALIIVFGLLPIAFFFSRRPVDPNADFEDEEVYVAVANPVENQHNARNASQLSQPLRS